MKIQNRNKVRRAKTI